MQEYSSLYRFNENGMEIFEENFLRWSLDEVLEETSDRFAEPIAGTRSFRVGEMSTAKQLATSILSALGNVNLDDLLPDIGFWSWLTFVLREELFQRQPSGTRKLGERHRWYPSDPNDWLKAQRHLVRMPVLLLHFFDRDADHLLCGKPMILPDIREQLTSQQDMFDQTFQKVARALYFDDHTGGLKRGAGGKAGGSARRLAKVRQQFDVTWELEDLGWEAVLAKLPREFDRFRPNS